jgi:cytochrome c oxidase subunit 4
MSTQITHRTYWRTAAALFILLIASVVTAMLHLGDAGLPIALTISAVKICLVALFFMHLRVASGVARLFAGAGLFWLAILIALTFGDYLTRT